LENKEVTSATRTGRRIDPAEAKNPLDNPVESNKEIDSLLKSTVSDYPTPGLPPDDLVVLPGGLVDSGMVVRNVVVRELTGEDEEALARAVRGGNFFHYIDTLLERGTVAIGNHREQADVRKQLKSLLVGEEALARAVRGGNFFHYIDTLLERGTVAIGNHREQADVRKQLKSLLVG